MNNLLILAGVVGLAIIVPEYMASRRLSAPMFSEQLRMLKNQEF